jgi:hypothetical protein
MEEERMNFRRWVAVLILILVAVVFLFMRMRSAGVDSGQSTAASEAQKGLASASMPAAAMSGQPGATNGGGGASAAAPANATKATTPEEERFRHHETLVKMRQAVWDYQQQLRSAGVPADTQNLFNEWAMVLYRDSLRVGIDRRRANDPLAQDMSAALRADARPQIDMIQKADLGEIPEARTTNLLVKVATLSALPELPEAQWMASEFDHLFKKAKQRSDSFYMSEMKDVLNSQAPIEQKTGYVERFIVIRDVTLSAYPQEYFEQLLQGTTLDPNQRVKVQGLLEAIRQMRTS